MEQIVQFIFANYPWIIPAALSVVELVLIIIFKRTKLIDTSLYFRIISMINAVEKKFGGGNGNIKKDYVISWYLSKYPNTNVKDLEDAIELVLSTPQKKGGKKWLEE